MRPAGSLWPRAVLPVGNLEGELRLPRSGGGGALPPPPLPAGCRAAGADTAVWASSEGRWGLRDNAETRGRRTRAAVDAEPEWNRASLPGP